MTITNDDLSRFADRLDRVLDEVETASAAMKDLKAEIKSAGFDPAALRSVAKLRRDDRKRARAEERDVRVVARHRHHRAVRAALGEVKRKTALSISITQQQQARAAL